MTEETRLLADQKESIEERRAATHDTEQLRRALRDGAKVIVRVGKLVKLDDATMSTMVLLGTASYADLAAYIDGLIERVTPHAAAFVAEGLPADLLQNLTGRLEAFAAAREAQTTSRRRYTVATNSIRALLDKGDDAIDALEAILVETPDAHPEVVSKLRIAKRVGPRIKAPEEGTAPSPNPTVTPTDKAA